jgi:hypothetical protein
MFLTWTVADTSNYVAVKHTAHTGLVAAIVALVR